MATGSITLDSSASIIFIGNSYTFGRVDPVMHYNSANVHDLTAPSNGGNFTNTDGSNPYEPHPWGGVPGVFKQFTVEAGLSYDVSISARNAATLQGHYLNSNAAKWDLRGNLASKAWDTVVLQDNSTQALPSGAGSITFDKGSSTATLTLTPIADTKLENAETIGLTLSAGDTTNSYQIGTSSTVTGTILNGGPTNDPTLPTITLTANPSAVFEDSGQALVYTFTRSGGDTTKALTIGFAAARDGATAPSVQNDFQPQSGSIYKFESGNATTVGSLSFSGTNPSGSITFAANATTATLKLIPQADTTVETDESIRLTLTSPTGAGAYNVGTPGPVAITILNDDYTAPPNTTVPSITLSLPKTAVYENTGDKLVYTFTRTGSTDAALTVNFGVSGTATRSLSATGDAAQPVSDFTVDGATSFKTAGASDPNLTSFQTYAVKLAQYATTGAADAANNVPANANANASTNVYLYETWARPNLVTGAVVANTNADGSITNTTTTAPEYYTSIEAMTADLKAAYQGLAASNPIFKGVAPVGEAFLAAVQNGTAIRDPYTTTPGTTVGNLDLWWDDNLHASKYGSYLSGLTLFATITGLDPRSLGSVDKVASDLGIDPSVAAALQNVAAATVGFSLKASWTAPGQVTELQGVATGLLASSGGFTFADSVKADTHTVGVTAETADALGTLTASLHGDSTGDGSGGAVNWTYTVDDAKVEYLGAGETRVEKFLISVSDLTGGSVQREIAVTINGTNDAPVVAGAVMGTAMEGGARVTLDALAKTTDADSSAVLSVVNVPTSLPPGVTFDATTHSFTLNPSDPAYQAQSAGQKQAVTVSYAVSDGIADPVTASVTFNVTLDTTSPSAPTIALAADTGASATDHLTSNAGITVTPAETGGSLSYSVDNGPSAASYTAPTAQGPHTVSVTQTDAAGNVSAAGTLGFTLDTLAPALALSGVSGQANHETGHALSGSIDAADAGASVTIRDGATVLGTTTADGSGTFSFGFSDTKDGPTHSDSFTATATDAAGNTGTSDTFVFNFDYSPNQGLFGTLTHDPMSHVGEVYALYEGLLDRAPDQGGAQDWVSQLDHGASLAQVTQGFLNSVEERSHITVAGNTNAAYVEQLYESVLHRPGDAAGAQGWTNFLDQGGSRVDVADAFVFSTEHENQLQPAYAAGVYLADPTDAAVARLYYGLLDRAPDAGGLQTWEGAAHSGTSLTSIAQSFLASAEYGQLHPAVQTDRQFVDSLYQDALGRPADAGGEKGWLDFLQAGAPRAQVAVGIAESPEAQAHLAGHIEQGWHLA